MTYIVIKGDELYHHGIKGMKWGVKNGPPYPLVTGAKSKKELQADKKNQSKKHKPRLFSKGSDKKDVDQETLEKLRHHDAQNERDHKEHSRIVKESRRTGKSAAEIERTGLSDRQKKLIKIGAIAAVSALAAYGAYSVYKNNNFSLDTKSSYNNSANELFKKYHPELCGSESGKNEFISKAFSDCGDFKAYLGNETNKAELDSKLTSVAGEWWNGLSKAEKTATEHYSGDDFTAMSDALWKAKGDNILLHAKPKTAIDILNLQKALDKASYPDTMICSHGLTLEHACSFLGCSEKDLISAAKNPAMAEKFIGAVNTNYSFLSTTTASDKSFSGAVKYRVLVPKGAHAAYIEHISSYGDLFHPPSWDGKKTSGGPFSTEFETLIAAGSKFKTKAIQMNAEGAIEVALELLAA